MTGQETLNQARDQYNGTSDPFFTDTLLLSWVTDACNIMAREAELIENIYSTTTVANQQSYAYPTNTIGIKRITYNGRKIKRLTFREDDAITLSNQASQQSGSPVYYSDFNFTIYLRPMPDAAYTLSVYSFNQAQAVTATSSLEIPSMWQMSPVKYILHLMYAKDQNPQMATFWKNQFDSDVISAKRWKAKSKRTDSFTTVQDESSLPVTIMGEV